MESTACVLLTLSHRSLAGLLLACFLQDWDLAKYLLALASLEDDTRFSLRESDFAQSHT